MWDLPAVNTLYVCRSHNLPTSLSCAHTISFCCSKFEGNPVGPALRLQEREIEWINQRDEVGLDAASLDTTSCEAPTRLSCGYSVCLATQANVLLGEARSADESASSGGAARESVKAMSAEQDAENRHAMVITASVAAAVLVAIAVGLVFVYRGGGAKETPPAERPKPKPAVDAGTGKNTQPSRPPASTGRSNELKAPPAVTVPSNESPNSELLKWKVESRELALEDEIAWGRSCAVFTAIYRGNRVVVKKVLHSSEATFRQELSMLSQFRHEKIVQFIGVAWVRQFQKLQLVLEYMPYGDLQTYLSTIFIERQNSPQAQQYFHDRWSAGGSAMKIALDVAEALEYAHSVTSVEFTKRRVLTSRQILLDDELHAKLSDFGSQQRVDNTTARWLAPEVLDGEANYSEATEVYALGVVLWELDTCDLPFARFLPERDFGLSRVEHNDEIEIVWQRVAKGELKLTPRDDCPPMVRELILRCLAPEPFDRPSMFAVLHALRESAALGDKGKGFAGGNSGAFSSVSVLSSATPVRTPVREEWI